VILDGLGLRFGRSIILWLSFVNNLILSEL